MRSHIIPARTGPNWPALGLLAAGLYLAAVGGYALGLHTARAEPRAPVPVIPTHTAVSVQHIAHAARLADVTALTIDSMPADQRQQDAARLLQELRDVIGAMDCHTDTECALADALHTTSPARKD